MTEIPEYLQPDSATVAERNHDAGQNWTLAEPTDDDRAEAAKDIWWRMQDEIFEWLAFDLRPNLEAEMRQAVTDRAQEIADEREDS